MIPTERTVRYIDDAGACWRVYARENDWEVYQDGAKVDLSTISDDTMEELERALRFHGDDNGSEDTEYTPDRG